MDDLLQFAVAQQSGLSWDLLGLNVFQHFAPINRFAHLLLIRLVEFSLTAGQLAAAGLVVALQASLWWLLHELRVPFGRTLLGLVAVGFRSPCSTRRCGPTPRCTSSPPCRDQPRARRPRARHAHRQRLWHAASVVPFAGGILTQERALFALPLALMVDWFLLGAGEPLVTVAATADGDRAVRPDHRRGGGRGGVHLRRLRQRDERPSRTGDDGPHGARRAHRGDLPAVAGIRLDELSPLPVQLAILALLLVGAGGLIAIRRRTPIRWPSWPPLPPLLRLPRLQSDPDRGGHRRHGAAAAQRRLPARPDRPRRSASSRCGRRKPPPVDAARARPPRLADRSWRRPPLAAAPRGGRRSVHPDALVAGAGRARLPDRARRRGAAVVGPRRHPRAADRSADDRPGDGRSCTAGTSSSSASTGRAGWASRSAPTPSSSMPRARSGPRCFAPRPRWRRPTRAAAVPSRHCSPRRGPPRGEPLFLELTYTSDAPVERACHPDVPVAGGG